MSLEERARFLKDKLGCSYECAIQTGLLMDIYDKLVELNNKQDELLESYPLEDDVKIEGDEWKEEDQK